jgi:predicted transcriptional regulator
MGKHRSKLEQQIEILLMLNQEDCLQSDIMYGCKLTHVRLVNLLQGLVEKRLIAWNERTGKYWLTIAGQDALGRFAALSELI